MWLKGCLSDKLSVWLTDWLTCSTGKQADALLTNKYIDWYAGLTNSLTGCWHADDWQMSARRWVAREEVGSSSKTEGKGKWGGGGDEGLGSEKESTMFSCDAKAPPEYLCALVLDPGFLGTQTDRIISGCWQVPVNGSEIPAGTSGVCVCAVCAFVHDPLLGLVCIWICMCVSVILVCSSLTMHTSLSSFIWTATVSQFTIAPAALCARYWGICDTCKLGSAGPNWYFDGQALQTE